MTGAELALKRAHERNLVLVKDPSSKLQFSKSQVRVWKTLKKTFKIIVLLRNNPISVGC